MSEETNVSGLVLAVCNVESLDPQHRRHCEDARRYVPPLKIYRDLDGIVHDPSYRLPTYNPENRTRSGIYVLDFMKRYKEDSRFRDAMKTMTRIELGLD